MVTDSLKTLKCAVALALCLFSSSPGLAHEGPEHDIEELTERMDREGESAQLLFERAIEYQVIRKNSEAVKDLERALVLQPRWPTIQRELGRAYFATGKTNEALTTVSRGLEGPASGADRASLFAVRAEILRARNDLPKALEDLDNAIKEHPHNLEWYLLRSQIHRQLNLRTERLSGLDQGIKQTGSGVLQIERIEALIDAEQYPQALEKIEAELKSSRLRSSWLIRRAKVDLATENKERAKVDLEAAIQELNSRISSSAPDPSLLADRALAHDLLGNTDKALKDYILARDKGLTDEWLQERIRTLKPEASGDKETTSEGRTNSRRRRSRP